MRVAAGPRISNIIGKRVLVFVAALIVSACGVRDADQKQRVDPADYSAFYLWSGVRPPAAMENADAVYLLWGELRRDDPSRIISLRRTVPTGDAPELWLVVRAERLDWGEEAYAQLFDQARRWNADGKLTGVQVDFDSSTGGLGAYAAFLRGLRAQLPRGLKLSVTGLMDWPANASDDDLAAMRDALDEIVIQTYQDTETLPGYDRYLTRIERLDMPHRIALVEGGEWSPPSHLAADAKFNGYVVFLLRNQKP